MRTYFVPVTFTVDAPSPVAASARIADYLDAASRRVDNRYEIAAVYVETEQVTAYVPPAVEDA